MTTTGPRRFLGYSFGNAGIAVLRQIVVFMPLYFYSPPPGQGREYLRATAVGLALFLARLVDVVSDPVVGYWSDRTRHRWGKRLPYIVFGTPLWILFTVLIFTPPAAGHGTTNLVYLAVVGSLFFLSMTVVQIPYMAVLPEIAWHEQDAVRVAARMGKFYILGVLLILVGGWFLAGPCGFLGSATIFALFAGVALALAAAELFGLEQRPVENYRHRFWSGALAIVRERPFWTYLVGHSLFVCGYYCILVACPFYATEIVRLPRAFTGLFFLIPMLSAIVLTPLVERLTLRAGKKPVMLAAMIAFSAFALLWFLPGKLPGIEGGATLAGALGLEAGWASSVNLGVAAEAMLLFVLIGAPVAVQMLVPPALVADLVVYDQRRNGQRRESLVYGLQGGIEKNAVMVATLVVSLALQGGKAAADPAGIYLVGPAAAGLTLLGCLVFLLYPLKKGWQDSTTGDS